MAFRIFRAEKSLTITEKVEKMTEVIQAEGTASSVIIKVVILDEVRKELERKKKLEKKKSTSASATANPKRTKAKTRRRPKEAVSSQRNPLKNPLHEKEPPEATSLPRKTHQVEVQSLRQRTRTRKARP